LQLSGLKDSAHADFGVRKVMMEIYLLTTAALVVFGIAIGVVLVVSLGIHREERNSSLMHGTTDRMLRGTRRVTGFTSTSSA
jgi:hypothetical protein